MIRFIVSGSVLVEVLTRRFRFILDASFNADASDAPAQMAKLDNEERRLYAEVRHVTSSRSIN